METNDIKKSLYKEKTKATLLYIRKGTAYYCTTLFSGAKIYFDIPVSDMGDADFTPEMEAKLLIRWISTYTPPPNQIVVDLETSGLNPTL